MFLSTVGSFHEHEHITDEKTLSTHLAQRPHCTQGD